VDTDGSSTSGGGERKKGGPHGGDLFRKSKMKTNRGHVAFFRKNRMPDRAPGECVTFRKRDRVFNRKEGMRRRGLGRGETRKWVIRLGGKFLIGMIREVVNER